MTGSRSGCRKWSHRSYQHNPPRLRKSCITQADRSIITGDRACADGRNTQGTQSERITRESGLDYPSDRTERKVIGKPGELERATGIEPA
jgi:hypothetical protein